MQLADFSCCAKAEKGKYAIENAALVTSGDDDQVLLATTVVAIAAWTGVDPETFGLQVIRYGQIWKGFPDLLCCANDSLPIQGRPGTRAKSRAGSIAPCH